MADELTYDGGGFEQPLSKKPTIEHPSNTAPPTQAGYEVQMGTMTSEINNAIDNPGWSREFVEGLLEEHEPEMNWIDNFKPDMYVDATRPGFMVFIPPGLHRQSYTWSQKQIEERKKRLAMAQRGGVFNPGGGFTAEYQLQQQQSQQPQQQAMVDEAGNVFGGPPQESEPPAPDGMSVYERALANYTPGSLNPQQYQGLYSDIDDTFVWQDMIQDRLEADMLALAKVRGENTDMRMAWMKAQLPAVLSYLDNQVVAPSLLAGDFDENGHTFWTKTAEGLNRLYLNARLFLNTQEFGLYDDLVDVQEKANRVTTSGGGSGLSSRDFDVQQLALRIREMWRGYLFTDNSDALKMAKAYVQEVLSAPDQARDFETWVILKIRETQRYGTIYADKPDSLSEAEFMQPYFQSALQTVGPAGAAELAIAGARMHADPHAFNMRLGRTRAVQNSSTFLNGIESSLRALKGVLR